MGFSDGRVLGLVLAESCLLAGSAGLLGLGLAWLLITGDPTGGLLPVFFIPGRDLVIGIVLALVLGVAAGMLPAWQAQRLQVADALRR